MRRSKPSSTRIPPRTLQSRCDDCRGDHGLDAQNVTCPPRSNTGQPTVSRWLRVKVEKGIAARRIAGWGRTPYRYASGEVESLLRLLRLLVLLRLTLSERKFEDIVKQL